MAERGGLSGSERAAVLLLSMGEERAAEVMRHMGPREVRKVGVAMASLRDVRQEQVDEVLGQFVSSVGEHSALGVDSERYVRNVLVQALGKEKGGSIGDRILLGGASQGVESLRWMEPRAVLDLLRGEHPQVIAVALAYLEPEQAAGILGWLPEGVRADVVHRIATLDTVQPAALDELDALLAQQSQGPGRAPPASLGGIKAAAEILNHVEPSVEARILEGIRVSDGDLGQQIQDLMFVFDNLLEVDDQGIQQLLREVSSASLVVALKGADEALREKILANMSKRAGEILRDDLQAKGPVRLSEVEAAQKEILDIARRLADEGQIGLGGRGGDEFV